MEESMKSVALNQIAEVELIYKSKVKASERPKISHSKDAYIIFKDTWDENKIELQEQFKVMLLNRANKVLGIYEVSTGGMTGTIADPKLIFIAALKAGACSIMLVHNHPSGNLKPSKQDEQVTCKIKQGGKLLDIVLLDHLIISNEGYFSMQDEGFI